MKKFIHDFFYRLLTIQCAECKKGRVSFSHTISDGKKKVNAYVCDKCNAQYV